jgi:hypothetical protein
MCTEFIDAVQSIPAWLQVAIVTLRLAAAALMFSIAAHKAFRYWRNRSR